MTFNRNEPDPDCEYCDGLGVLATFDGDPYDCDCMYYTGTLPRVPVRVYEEAVRKGEADV